MSTSAAAGNYNNHNSGAMEGLIAEIRNRLDWIGIDFLDSDDEDEEDDELATADDNANDGDVSGDQRTLQKKTVRFLDYACGSGMVSQALSPYITEAVGIDLSTNMAAEYNMRANAQGLSAAEMSATVGNIFSESDPHPAHLAAEKFFNFDLAAVGLGFHHFEDPVLSATRLAERLRPGGVLLVIDFLPHGNDHWAHGGNGEGSSSGGGHHHHHAHGLGHGHHAEHGGDGMELKLQPEQWEKAQVTVQHHGFSEEEMKAAFEAAGLGKDFAYDVVERPVVFKNADKTMKRRVFMARGTKA